MYVVGKIKGVLQNIPDTRKRVTADETSVSGKCLICLVFYDVGRAVQFYENALFLAHFSTSNLNFAFFDTFDFSAHFLIFVRQFLFFITFALFSSYKFFLLDHLNVFLSVHIYFYF